MLRAHRPQPARTCCCARRAGDRGGLPWTTPRVAVGLHRGRGCRSSRSPGSSASAPSSSRAAPVPPSAGLLNATFGNAAELIIAVVALHGGHVAPRQGVDHRQHHRQPAAGARACPSSSAASDGTSQKFDADGGDQHVGDAVSGRRRAGDARGVRPVAVRQSLEAHPKALDDLSMWSAIVLIVAYAGSLVYAFTAHRDLFRPMHAG